MRYKPTPINYKAFVPAILTASLMLSACGSGNSPKATDAPKSAATSAPSTAAPQATPQITATKAANNTITNFKDAKKAVVRIESTGSYMAFGESQKRSSTWGGSGFLISPDGYIVTNNHVAVGAAALKVFIGGDSNSLPAKLVASSECSDLAVLKVNGDNLPYLEWESGKAEVGTEVYAAGFPLNDPEYTLTKGIISKANSKGDSSWASVETVIEHDANINPGNSGGPLIATNGKVLGVNYAGNDKTRQFFAIPRDLAINIVKKLQSGKPFEAVGINGEAFKEKDVSGIWIASIEPGSPADKAGLQSGDVIMSIEGIDMGKDGTLKAYCNILRSHNREDTLGLKVFRFSTKETFEGQLNGRALVASTKPNAPTPAPAAVATTAPTKPTTTAAKVASINLVNQSGYTIDTMLFASPNDKNWGNNVLASSVANGKSFMLTNIKPGIYDITVRNNKDNIETLYSVNLTGESTWTVQEPARLPNSAKVIFEDSFSDNRNKWGLAKSSANVTYTPPNEGIYCLRINKADYLGWEWYEPLKSNNFFAQVQCLPDEKGASCGIGYGVDSDNLIWFSIVPATQDYRVEFLDDGEWGDDLIKATATNYINPKGSNYLAIGRQENKFTIYVNGVLLGTKDIGDLPAGRFGIGGGTDAKTPSSLICMDNLKVWQVK